MENSNEQMSERDRQLWKVAKKRVAFRRHLASYVIINGFLWAIWFFGHDGEVFSGHHGFPWPVWSTVGWGIGLAFNYYDAYHGSNVNTIEKEFEKLKKKQD